MQLLIDGYNVLFAAGAMPRHSGPGELARSREWLLRLLLEHLSPSELRETTIVFDAKNGPRHLSPEYYLHGVRVLFARDHDEADDLIENLIHQHATPKKLTVVSSDLRLRETARRRRCRVTPSDDWLEFIEDQRPAADQQERTSTSQAETREGAVAAGDVEQWLLFFGQEPQPVEKPSDRPATPDAAVVSGKPRLPETEAPPRSAANDSPRGSAPTGAAHPARPPRATPKKTESPLADSPSKPIVPPRRGPRGRPRLSPKPLDREVPGDRESPGWSPFPPGYGEDLLEPPPQ